MNDKILKKIESDFEESKRQLVLNYLKKIHLNDVWQSQGNLENTRFSILMLADGSVYRVKDLVKSAKSDFRDVVAAASQMKPAKRKLP